MRFGFELECRSNADEVLSYLHDIGAAATPDFHSYHCRCGSCNYANEEFLFFGQDDCTVDGEIISTILEYGSERHRKAVSAISSAMVKCGANTWGNTGLHVHVDRSGFTTRRQRRILHRLVYRYAPDLCEIAAGSQETVRGYNDPPESALNAPFGSADWYGGYSRFDAWDSTQIPHCGSWLSEKSNTYEFRMWNATRAEWRINLAIGLSVAMVRAALERQDTGTGANDPRPLEAILRPYLDAETWDGLLRQRFLKGGMG